MDEMSWLSSDALRRAAGERPFARGAEYHALGQVLSLAEYRGAIAAVVQGARRYRVLLRSDGRGIAGRCNCPAADGGACCKHCVAAGLAYLDGQSRRESRQPVTLPVVLEDVAARLRARPHDELVELLLAEALESEGLRERLLLDAANHTGKPIEIESYLRAVELALSKALWSEGDEAGQTYLIELKDSLGRLAAAARWDDLRTIVAHALELLAASKRPSPAAIERLRTFSEWLRRFPGKNA
jgi:uncharacterized Zn finger protein